MEMTIIPSLTRPLIFEMSKAIMIIFINFQVYIEYIKKLGLDIII
jgi:hypothetical protein